MTETNVKKLEEQKEKELVHAKKILDKILEISVIRRNCKECYGRGYVGYDILNKDYVLCLCLSGKKRILVDDNLAEKIEELENTAPATP